MSDTRPPRIGVFDSGVGGLTVLHALLGRIPQAEYAYLGDTARLPYGSKSPETITRYAVSSVRFLLDQGSDFLVIACNTASALALEPIREAASPVPVIGVIETGANAAQANSQTGDVLVMATAATVASHAYRAACQERGLRAIEKACPLLVPLVEEGWVDHPVTSEVISIYVNELLGEAEAGSGGFQPDTLVLGCTHYPLLRGGIERAVAEHTDARDKPQYSTLRELLRIRVIDSAEVTAAQVAERLGLEPHPCALLSPARRFYATDSVTRFSELGARFLAQPIPHVEHIDLGG